VQGKGWQEFVNHIAERQNARQRKEEMPGRVLYAVIFSAIAAALLVMALKSLGAI